MEKNVEKAVLNTVRSLLEFGAKTATSYLSEKLVVRVSRPTFGPIGKKRIPKVGNIHLVLTVGKPNYKSREFIKSCKKNKESFPLKGVYLSFPSKK